MKILTPGHLYEVDNFENSNDFQRIQFIEKEQRDDPSQPCKTINDGTTNEEVLAMLIDRCKYLNEMLPSRQTSIAITKMQEALMWLENRTTDRVTREVEGTHVE